MNAIHKIEHWGDTHHPAILDLLRITLGIFLFLKGYGFFHNMAFLEYTIQEQNLINLSPAALEILMYYITFMHLAGGILITLGLLTRLSSILQLPIVIGAVFFINIFKTTLNSDLWLSIFACVLLVMFAFIGSGPISLNRVLSLPNR
ncbi:DoxX family protein [Mucilaginibacter lutimaris]|uniref:DoxX family protein n=1 Tax=Mucilaginibacter lutimaris TaxID=931629 RepID=A0ABW2ZKW2_9SPHI